jgi:hypothetical protein
MVEWVERYGPYFGFVFLLSGVLLLSSGVMAVYDWEKGRRQESQRIQQMRQEESQRTEQR